MLMGKYVVEGWCCCLVLLGVYLSIGVLVTSRPSSVSALVVDDVVVEYLRDVTMQQEGIPRVRCNVLTRSVSVC